MAEISPTAKRIAENAAEVRRRIAAAAARAGRSGEAVKLVAVTKYFGSEVARQVVEAGCNVLGENRPQELERKAADLADLPVEWHLIGSLQKNKVRKVLASASLIHSVDDWPLLAAIQSASAALGKTAAVLLEVNCSGDATKHGFSPEGLEQAWEAWPAHPNVRVRGLMTMAALDGGPEVARANFAALRNLRDRLAARTRPDVELRELSMGMSGDYEIAVEEGATIVRVGTALYEGAVAMSH